MPEQLRQVIEWVGLVQFAGVDQAHEQIPGFGAVQGAIEQSILAVQHGAFERAFTDVMPPPGLWRVLCILALPACVLTVSDAA